MLAHLEKGNEARDLSGTQSLAHRPPDEGGAAVAGVMLGFMGGLTGSTLACATKPGDGEALDQDLARTQKLTAGLALIAKREDERRRSIALKEGKILD